MFSVNGRDQGVFFSPTTVSSIGDESVWVVMNLFGSTSEVEFLGDLWRFVIHLFLAYVLGLNGNYLYMNNIMIRFKIEGGGKY